MEGLEGVPYAGLKQVRWIKFPSQTWQGIPEHSTAHLASASCPRGARCHVLGPWTSHAEPTMGAILNLGFHCLG